VVDEIAQHIRALPGTDDKELQTAFLRLDDKDFKKRNEAESILRHLNVLAVPHLEGKLKDASSLEQAGRVRALLRQAERPTPRLLRIYRLIRVLEYVGSEEAIGVLRTISRRADIKVFALYAKESIERLTAVRR
jgi:hypothetical protein